MDCSAGATVLLPRFIRRPTAAEDLVRIYHGDPTGENRSSARDLELAYHRKVAHGVVSPLGRGTGRSPRKKKGCAALAGSPLIHKMPQRGSLLAL